jgi:hypothetical protein
MSVRYLELMEQKNSVIERILSITREVSLTGERDLVEKEAEAFVVLYERRDNIIKRIEKIDEALKAESKAMGLPPGGDLVSEKYRQQLEAIIEKQRDMVAALLVLDAANIKAYDKMKQAVTGDLKRVRQNIDLNTRYMGDIDGHQGFLFDKKN